MRIIDADHLSERVNNSNDTPMQKLYVSALLASEPTIEARPVVRGEWLPSPSGSGSIMCSKCFAIRDGGNYCSHCGADMRGN